MLSKLAYVWQGTEMMRKEFVYSNWRYKFQVRLDDEEEWYEASSVIVGKSRYYAGRYSLFNGASLCVPQLHVAILPVIPGLTLCAMQQSLRWKRCSLIKVSSSGMRRK